MPFHGEFGAKFKLSLPFWQADAWETVIPAFAIPLFFLPAILAPCYKTNSHKYLESVDIEVGNHRPAWHLSCYIPGCSVGRFGWVSIESQATEERAPCSPHHQPC